tara:strand:- start:774 stop:1688 length:915 start_codon:yes stop_codon:yes gene_type:complete
MSAKVVGPPSPMACTVADVILELGPEHVLDITHRSVVMAILNRTTDSFFDQGRHWDFDDFLRLAEQHVADGADILDIGGVRAAPGPEVTAAEEIDRVVPAIAALHKRFDLPISVDTFRGSVVDAALSAGACIGNDISGFADPTFLSACARHGASVVATHVRIGPRIADPEPRYEDLRDEVRGFLIERGRWAGEAGIPRRRIMLDAGLDLGKTPSMSAELLRHSADLASLGYPILLSASNKGFLGALVGTEVDDRIESTWAAHALGIGAGCRILRVHDVQGARRVADLMAALLAEDERAAREPVG